MSKLKITLIVSVLNEEQTIQLLLKAIHKQTRLPDELIIVDGGSQDRTITLIEEFFKTHPLASQTSLKFTLKTLPKSNRSLARNWAIKNARHDLIAITDAGCIPQPTWLKKLIKKYQETQSNIVGGYFYGLPETPFEQAVVSYTLEMPGKINPKNFIPTTRSVLLTKQTWEKLGGFNEKLSLNEDFEFFYKAKQQNLKFAFTKDALVGWLPRRNLVEFSKMIFRFAQGDVQAGIIRSKVQLLFGRYILVILAVLFLIFFTQISFLRLVLILSFWLGIYLLWAIQKNLQYAPQGWYWLPVLQITADLVVMAGSLKGVMGKNQLKVNNSFQGQQ